MYHFFSPTGADGAPPLPPPPDDESSTVSAAPVSPESVSGAVALAIDQLRQVRPDEVEHAEDDRRDDGHHHHHERGGPDLLPRGPGDLLQLAGDLVGEGVDAIISIEDDAPDEGDHGGHERDLEFGRRRRDVAPDPVDRPLQHVEQEDRTT